MTASAEPSIHVDPPPALEEDEGAAGVLTSAVPMLGSLGSVALVATMASGAGGQRSLLAAGAFLLGTLGFVVVQLDRQRVRRRRRREASRRGYARHLGQVRRLLVAAADRERHVLLARHPPPAGLAALVATGRLARDDPDLTVRWAVGDRQASVVVVAPESSDEPDPAALDALRRLLAGHADVRDVPLTLDLRATPHLVVTGGRGRARALVRALVAQAVAAHPPDRLAVSLAAGSDHPPWDWLKWLPHLTADGAGHRLVVVDGGTAPEPAAGATVVELAPATRSSPVPTLHVGDDGSVVLERPGRDRQVGRADGCDVATAEALARRLLRNDGGHGRARPDDPLAALHEVLAAPGAPPRWACRRPLRVPLGTHDDGSTAALDLEESARGGHGPHGLVVGATGSGKSELLRTLVLGLVVDHPPERLALVLVDFKGGATFAGLEPLPHVAGSVTNLADDLALVDRVHDALSGELVRRQEVLRAASVTSLHEYAGARAAGADLPPLPSLLVVVDEFAEMLAVRPELLDVFTAIGRLGRSLGLHLLLASQRLDEGRLRGLEAHLSYRVGLRTFSAAESRAVLGVPDAATLPAVPGTGYLRTGPVEPVRFRAAYVSGAVVARPEPVVRPFRLDGAPRPAVATAPAGPSLLDRVVARLADHGERARRVWWPPLDRPATVGALLGPVVRDPELGLVATRGRQRPLLLPLGLVDRPKEQRVEPWVADLAGAGGHVGVVGGPRSGRTTALQTLVTAVALTRTPREAHVVLLDLAGGGLAGLAPLPHVVAHATRAEPDVVRRVVGRLVDLLDEREQSPDAERPDLFVVVDGWADLRADHEDLEPVLQRLATRGLGLGLHLVVATGRWADLRAATRDLLGTRLELRLGDPLDSEVDRRTARQVPRDRPGRGLTPDGHHLLTALPRLDDVPFDELVDRVADAWPGDPAPRLGRLPDDVRLADVHGGAGLVLGADDRGPVSLDPAEEPHLLVMGDRGSGRSTLLRARVAEVVRTRGPREAQLVVVDPRRGLVDAVPPDHLLGHHSSAATAEPALRELADHLRGRLPGPDVTADQLRDRSWWSGAEVHVLVDDHELLGGTPLAPLLPLLPHAADVGLRVVVCRRATGAARALHEPDLRTLRDLAAPVLLLPGNPDEGPLVGRVAPRPGPPGRGRLVTAGGVVTELQVARP